jgi:archaellum component FlaC
MKNGLRVAAFFCFSFLLIFTASAVVQSIWVRLTSDSRSVIKEIVTAEVNKQDSYSSPEQAAGNFRNVQKEKDGEDAAYKADLRSVTGEFNRTRQKRDDLSTKFQGKSQELEEIQKSIQNLKKGVENCNSSITRFEEDIKSQQLSLEKWLKTEKQGEAAIAVIYTRGFRDVAHTLETLADQASAPLLAESMGVKIRSYSQVINNVLAKDIVQATTEGTSKPVNEEPFKLELDKTTAGTIYLRLKRYELFPFQYPAADLVKPGKESSRFKAQLVTSGADLESFLKASGYASSKGDLVRLQQVIEDAKENNSTAEYSLGSQIETYQSRIKQLKEKI